MFALVLYALSASCWSRSPDAAINAWRTKRLGLWTSRLEARWDADYRDRGKVRPEYRYRTQILVVDSGDGMRARTCEAIVDFLCGSSAADIDCASTVLGSVVAQQERPAAAELCALLGLPPIPFEQPPRRLIPSDLLITSRWDVVLCVDLATLERVRSLARAVNVLRRAGGSVPSGDRWDEDTSLLQWSSHLSGEGDDAAILCASDFLAGCVPITREGFVPEELQPYLAESKAGSQRLLDLPCTDDGLASEQLGRAKSLLGAAATCSVGLITYLEAAMLEHARKLYRRDLAASFPRPRDLATSSPVSGGAGGVREGPQGGGASATVPYEEVAQHMQFDHAVPGGLSDDERRCLFDEYMEAKVGGRAEGGGAGGIDVSDLGLTMDDLFGPMGGL